MRLPGSAVYSSCGHSAGVEGSSRQVSGAGPTPPPVQTRLHHECRWWAAQSWVVGLNSDYRGRVAAATARLRPTPTFPPRACARSTLQSPGGRAAPVAVSQCRASRESDRAAMARGDPSIPKGWERESTRRAVRVLWESTYKSDTEWYEVTRSTTSESQEEWDAAVLSEPAVEPVPREWAGVGSEERGAQVAGEEPEGLPQARWSLQAAGHHSCRWNYFQLVF